MIDGIVGIERYLDKATLTLGIPSEQLVPWKVLACK